VIVGQKYLLACLLACLLERDRKRGILFSGDDNDVVDLLLCQVSDGVSKTDSEKGSDCCELFASCEQIYCELM